MTTPDSNPSFFKRIPIAFGAFFSSLSDSRYAARILGLRQGDELATAPVPAPIAPAPLRQATPDAALQLLALLQREARLIDFTQENLGAYSDADIGGAARLVHEGCAKVLREYFTLAPVRPETEGSQRRPPDRQRGRPGAVSGQPESSRLARHRGQVAKTGSQP